MESTSQAVENISQAAENVINENLKTNPRDFLLFVTILSFIFLVAINVFTTYLKQQADSKMMSTQNEYLQKLHDDNVKILELLQRINDFNFLKTKG